MAGKRNRYRMKLKEYIVKELQNVENELKVSPNDAYNRGKRAALEWVLSINESSAEEYHDS